MLKKFLGGLVFGAGFGIAFVAVWVASFYFVVPVVLESRFGSGAVDRDETVVDAAPPAEARGRFLGSTASYSGGFMDNKIGVLAAGPGRIVGSVLAGDTPVAGLKLRLALNGSVLSQWATSDGEGRYSIPVPYGTYVIDGFGLDSATANRVLVNKINHPMRAHSGRSFEVAEGRDGRGLEFAFVDPIVKTPGKDRYSATDEIVLEWEPHPGAAKYFVQIYEKPDPDGWSNDTLFPWSGRPEVTEPRFTLNGTDVPLKPGFFYQLEVYAGDAQGRMLSETARTYANYDFEIVE